MRKFAEKKGGLCLATEYVNRRDPLEWQCKEGHKWKASVKDILKGTWCRRCSTLGRTRVIPDKKLIPVQRCIAPLNQENHVTKRQKCGQPQFNIDIITNILVPPSSIRRPDFLKTSKHPRGLELDIYYPQYGFAIEVQGKQHEQHIEHFHKNEEDFEKQLMRDQLKKELCEENWIVLKYVWYEDPYIVIPNHLRGLGLIE
ncbi:3765_t:CDS:2 [Funneliformis geosporum]|nr:3765_t:CDS:2 [Funneliformis geosporum]